jgi:hypothetical protein
MPLIGEAAVAWYNCCCDFHPWRCESCYLIKLLLLKLVSLMVRRLLPGKIDSSAVTAPVASGEKLSPGAITAAAAGDRVAVTRYNCGYYPWR